MPYFESLQKDVKTMVDIDMKYGQMWMKEADSAAFKSWTTTKTIMGCTKDNWKCSDPIVFFQTMPRSIGACGCTSFPIEISNIKMQCAQLDNGEFACM
jgi:hypothetical protein